MPLQIAFELAAACPPKPCAKAGSAFSEACFGVSELANIKFPTSRDSSLLAARSLQVLALKNSLIRRADYFKERLVYVLF